MSCFLLRGHVPVPQSKRNAPPGRGRSHVDLAPALWEPRAWASAAGQTSGQHCRVPYGFQLGPTDGPTRAFPGTGHGLVEGWSTGCSSVALSAWGSQPGLPAPGRVGWGGAGLAAGADTRAFFQERERLLRSKRHRGKGLKPPKVSPRRCGRPALLRAGVRGARPRERADGSHRRGLQAETPIATS